MKMKISHNRINPKKEKTFGIKKPFKSKGYNRKGRTGVKKIGLNPEKAVRFNAIDLKYRIELIVEIGCCQVCELSYELDVPHHVEQGLGVKDDRYMLNICVPCHRLIHSVGYSAVKKTRVECKEIAWGNHLKFRKVEL